MAWWNIYLVVCGTATLLSLILTPFFRFLAVKTDFMDRPANTTHKRHGKATPLLGGVAMCAAWTLTIGAGMLAPSFLAHNQSFSPTVVNDLAGTFSIRGQLAALLLCSVLATALGAYDDKFAMSARTKFTGQFIIAAIAVSWGDVRISLFIHNPVFIWCVSVLWIVVIMNAINFFDNMDGLAVGVAGIAFCFFTIAAATYSHHFVACLCAAGAGAAIGFWFFNHSPATIFMGDAGSHFLGFNLAAAGALTTFYQPGETVSRFSVLIPFFILAVPLFDMAAVVIIRLWIKTPLYIGDHNHISHRFFNMGMPRKEAVLAVHLITLAIGMGVLPLLWGDERTSAVCVAQACIILVLVSVLQYSARKDRPASPPASEPSEPVENEEEFN